MSDRAQGSVRTESPSGDAAADGTAPAAAQPVSATQAIPTTGSHRTQSPAQAEAPAPTQASAQAPATGSTPVGATAVGAPVGSSPAAPPVPPVPPATGAAPAVGADSATSSGTATSGTATSGTAVPAGGRGPRGRAAKTAGRGPRRARLQLRHIDTWSALKISLVLSIALFFIWMVAVGVLYGVLNALGVFDTLNDLFGQIGSASGAENTGDVVTPGLVFGGAAIIGAINIVLMTALCTVGTFIYNLCSDLVGGLELTLSERD